MEKKSKAKKFILSWGIPLITITSYGLLALQSDLRYSIPLITGVTAFLVIILASSYYFVEKQEIEWSPVMILSVAMLIRCLFVFRYPELSDDIYRYIWDGLQNLDGNNPYRHAPLDVPPRDEFSVDLLKRINHPDLITIYPPAAQVIFMTGVFLTKSVFGIKILLCCIDLAAIFVIMKILANVKLSPSAAAIYAWHPIPVLEIAASGHIDGAGILFLVVSLYCLGQATGTGAKHSERERNIVMVFSGVAFGLAVMVKLFPLFLLPCFVVMALRSKRLLFSLSAGSSALILTIPFLPAIQNLFDTLRMYIENWEFSNFAFRFIRDITSSGDITRLLLALAFLCVVFFSTINLRRKIGRDVDNRDFLNCPGKGRQSDEIRSTHDFFPFMKSLYTIALAFLLLNPTLYPWYGISLVCLLPFVSRAGGIILSWSLFLSYSILIDYIYIGEWRESSIIAALIWCAPVSGALAGKILEHVHLRL